MSQQSGRQNDSTRPLFRFEVLYTYQVGSTRHESTRYRFVDPHTDNSAAAERAVAGIGLWDLASVGLDLVRHRSGAWRGDARGVR